jgi:hypothetical protein
MTMSNYVTATFRPTGEDLKQRLERKEKVNG